MKSELWAEKYRPTRLGDMIGQDSFRLDAEGWIEHKDMPHLLLFGPAGVGKTAGAIVLANELLGDYLDNYLEINASDDRRLEIVRTQIREFAQSMKIGDVPFKLIHLDEMDGMTSDAQNALKRIMERYSENVRFIITCNDRNKIIHPIQSRCANYFFQRLGDQRIFDLVMKCLKNEKFQGIEEKVLFHFISAYNGDVRRVLTELQAALISGRPLGVQVVQSLKGYSEVIHKIVDGDKMNALELLCDMNRDGQSLQDICSGLHEVVMRDEIDYNKKFTFLRAIGEAEWRSTNMTPRVLLSWLVASIKI
jgi:replication factor C small subunit